MRDIRCLDLDPPFIHCPFWWIGVFFGISSHYLSALPSISFSFLHILFWFLSFLYQYLPQVVIASSLPAFSRELFIFPHPVVPVPPIRLRSFAYPLIFPLAYPLPSIHKPCYLLSRLRSSPFPPVPVSYFYPLLVKARKMVSADRMNAGTKGGTNRDGWKRNGEERKEEGRQPHLDRMG